MADCVIADCVIAVVKSVAVIAYGFYVVLLFKLFPVLRRCVLLNLKV